MKLLLAILAATVTVGGASAAAPTIVVPDTIYAGFTTATVSSKKSDTYVLVQCYQPDLAGAYVYAAYFPVADQKAVLGPLWSALWPAGPAECRAAQGWFAAQGFGEWHEIAATTFQVAG